MSIRDIIEAATPGPWFVDDPGDGNRLFVGNRADGRTHGLWQIVHMSSDRMCDLTEEAERRYRADARFIATFDPEHVALMEAEHRAVERYFVAFDYLGVAGSSDDVSPDTLRMAHREMYEAREALKIAHESIPAYRKEHGYE